MSYLIMDGVNVGVDLIQLSVHVTFQVAALLVSLCSRAKNVAEAVEKWACKVCR